MADAFDYIIAGGGMAGLSLAFYLNESSLRDKKTLVIDRDAKNKNDHTWCFWETGECAFKKSFSDDGKAFGFTQRKDFLNFWIWANTNTR